jgi:hypothetical protein
MHAPVPTYRAFNCSADMFAPPGLLILNDLFYLLGLRISWNAVRWSRNAMGLRWCTGSLKLWMRISPLLLPPIWKSLTALQGKYVCPPLEPFSCWKLCLTCLMSDGILHLGEMIHSVTKLLSQHGTKPDHYRNNGDFEFDMCHSHVLRLVLIFKTVASLTTSSSSPGISI